MIPFCWVLMSAARWNWGRPFPVKQQWDFVLAASNAVVQHTVGILIARVDLAWYGSIGWHRRRQCLLSGWHLQRP